MPKNDSIYTPKKMARELDFSELLSQYSKKGRKATNPIMLFTLLVYANSRGIESFFSSLKNEELYRINYISINDFNHHVEKSIHKYNDARPHATLLYKTLNAVEQAFFGKNNK